MKASPHTFVVDQDDEQIVLKIKGDESDHWVTNQHGEKEQFERKAIVNGIQWQLTFVFLYVNRRFHSCSGQQGRLQGGKVVSG